MRRVSRNRYTALNQANTAATCILERQIYNSRLQPTVPRHCRQLARMYVRHTALCQPNLRTHTTVTKEVDDFTWFIGLGGRGRKAGSGTQGREGASTYASAEEYELEESDDEYQGPDFVAGSPPTKLTRRAPRAKIDVACDFCRSKLNVHFRLIMRNELTCCGNCLIL